MTDIMPAEHFAHLLHPQHDTEKMQLINMIKARDSAIRADQARRDIRILQAEKEEIDCSSWELGWNAAIDQLSRKIERRAGIGKEKL